MPRLNMSDLWRRTLETLRQYARVDPSTNPMALRMLAADAQSLLDAGDPYVRIAELESELAALRRSNVMTEDMHDDRRGETSDAVAVAPKRKPGRPGKPRAA